MTLLRSAAYNLWFVLATLLYGVARPLRPRLRPAPRPRLRPLWAGSAPGRRPLDLRHPHRRHHRASRTCPPGAALIASQHQSAFDTLVWLLIVPRVSYVFKAELARIPLFGPMLAPPARSRSTAAPASPPSSPCSAPPRPPAPGPPDRHLPRRHPRRARRRRPAAPRHRRPRLPHRPPRHPRRHRFRPPLGPPRLPQVPRPHPPGHRPAHRPRPQPGRPDRGDPHSLGPGPTTNDSLWINLWMHRAQPPLTLQQTATSRSTVTQMSHGLGARGG